MEKLRDETKDNNNNQRGENQKYKPLAQKDSTTEKPLVVIIDEESRSNLESLKFRWFSDGESRNDKVYSIETPKGEIKTIKGTLIDEPKLSEHAGEYLYFELTSACNFSCRHCGIMNGLEHTPQGELIWSDAAYVTEEFAETLGRALKGNPYPLLHRNIFLGGGEPLINPHKFAKIYSALSGLEKTTTIATTNGCALPLKFEAFEDFVRGISSPYIFLSCSTAHQQQYAKLAKSGRFPFQIPADVDPNVALYEKAKIIGEHCSKLEIGFTINVVENGRKVSSTYTLNGDLRKYILESAKTKLSEEMRMPEIIQTEVDGYRQPCSQGQELAIRSSGDIYPHCYDVFTRTNKLGVVGLLVGKE
ncbi:hypothetical protein J4434_00010 [Candidatus Woesearchaeota archaeon]|nr:hypothetical protein [Candidatus Woesearchaeota archaeon]